MLHHSTQLNEGRAYEEGGVQYGNTGEQVIAGMPFFNGRVIRHYNLNMKVLDVINKSISAFIF
jgi:hypothetical protein